MPIFFAQTHESFHTMSTHAHDDHAGGTVTFVGTVRAYNRQKAVDHLQYESHQELASRVFLEIETTALKRFAILSCHAVHRLGEVGVGQAAVLVHVQAQHRHNAFMAARFIMDELKKHVPIWKKEVYRDGSHSWDQGCHGCVNTHKNTFDLLYHPVERAHQALASSVTTFRNKQVLLVGAGGLGCPLALQLTALGVGDLHVIDGDTVQESNLLRQFLYRQSDIGRKKVQVLKEFIEERNPYCTLHAHERFIDEAWLRGGINQFAVVVDGSDCAATKSLLKEHAFCQQVPLVSASVFQQDGEVGIFYPTKDGACLQCFQTASTRNFSGTCQQFGVFTHSCSMVAAVACEAVRAIISKQFLGASEIQLVQPGSERLNRIIIAKDPNCGVCGKKSENASTKKLVRIAR